MPAWRRRAKCIGTFAQATREQDEEVPPPSDASTSPERSAIERHNGGWGIALYCGYLRAGCGNDCSERRRRCSLCKVKCCTEACIANHPHNKGVCRHCTQAWNVTVQQGGFDIREGSRHSNKERFRSRSRDDPRSHQSSASAVEARGSVRQHQLRRPSRDDPRSHQSPASAVEARGSVRQHQLRRRPQTL